jgi:hypothetical protein
MIEKRKLVRCPLVGSAELATLFLMVIGGLIHYYYQSVFGKFFGVWLFIIGSSLFITVGSRSLNEITRNPDIARRFKKTSTVKRLATLLCAMLLSLIIIVGIMVLWFFGRLVFSGNIANPIYDLMFATAFITYIIAASYGIWWGKEHHK